MIDWIISKLFKAFELKSDKLVKKNLIYFENSTKLFVLITPYRSELKLFSRIEKIVNSRGQSFIAYRFPADVLTSDYKSTHDGFKKMQSDIVLDLKDLKKEYGFKEIEMMGFSLSCVLTLMIANGNPLVNDVKLVVPGHCLAESL
jgi:esterase/lipase